VQTKNKIVKTSRGDVAYDFLVLALGSTTDFYNIPGAAKYCHTLKSLADARAIINQLGKNFAIAARKNAAEKFLNIVVAGGGPTGVEISAAIADLIKKTFARRSQDAAKAKVILIEAAAQLLTQLPAGMRRRAHKYLRQKGVEVMLGKSVTEVTPDAIILKDGETVKTNTVIWTAGVKPNKIAFDFIPETDKAGKIVVNEFLQLKGIDNIFVEKAAVP